MIADLLFITSPFTSLIDILDFITDSCHPMQRSIIAYIAWMLWSVRNGRIFEHLEVPPVSIVAQSFKMAKELLLLVLPGAGIPAALVAPQ